MSQFLAPGNRMPHDKKVLYLSCLLKQKKKGFKRSIIEHISAAEELFGQTF